MKPHISKELQKTFRQKTQDLEKAKEQLKKEFFGIENAIEEIFENIKSWYLLSQLQERPLVVNLWGLTGVGKTSLILRLIELLDLSDNTFRFDMGRKTDYSFERNLEDIGDFKRSNPVIILDEFQHTKTLDPMTGNELDEKTGRLLWELIDSGKITTNNWDNEVYELDKFKLKAQLLLTMGVEVHNGKVTCGHELFRNETEDSLDSIQMRMLSKGAVHSIQNEEGTVKNLDFIGMGLYPVLMKFSDDKSLEIKKNMYDHLHTLNGKQSILFLEKILKNARKPKTRHFDQSLIFIVGNLDEAYKMSGDQSADIEADEFYRITKKINLTNIKQALKKRFRDEQIARLGNIHIIYPALRKSAYLKIIRKEIDEFFEKAEELFGIKFSYDKSMVDKIYSEGVFPTQGTRPVLTTIHQIIKNKLPLILDKIIQFDTECNLVFLKVVRSNILQANLPEKESTIEIQLIDHLDHLRNSRKDERQAVTAVHESGHAVLSAVLLNAIPLQIFSVTSNSDADGFIYMNNENEVWSLDRIIKKTAVLLGGLIAEELIFGKQNVTLSASSDIEAAYGLVDRAIKDGGLGTSPFNYSLHSNQPDRVRHNSADAEDEIAALINQAKSLAEKTLKEEKHLLIACARILKDASTLDKDAFKNLVDALAVNRKSESVGKNYYRNRIDEVYNEVQPIHHLNHHRQFILNKNKENVVD